MPKDGPLWMTTCTTCAEPVRVDMAMDDGEGGMFCRHHLPPLQQQTKKGERHRFRRHATPEATRAVLLPASKFNVR